LGGGGGGRWCGAQEVRRSDMISQLMPSQRSIGRQQKFLITQPRRVCVCVRGEGRGRGACLVLISPFAGGV
jgi:hypothetical protein